MPAVTPAEVQTGPSRTKIGSASTLTAGKRRASSAQTDQWVAARRPSSTPDAASRNAPVQTEATRRARAARLRSQSIRFGSAAAASTPWPAAQPAGRGERDRAGAGGGAAPGPRRALAQPVDQLRVRGRRFHALAAGD